jgi:SprT protein
VGSEARIASWIAGWAETWAIPSLTERIRCEASPRLRTSLGRCYPASGLIRIHRALFDEPEELLREVVCHEAAHLAVYLRHGRRARPHGREWKELMAAAGFDPRARLRLERLSPQGQLALQPRVLYRYSCPTCRVSRVARRRVRAWRCRVCREAGREGALEISTCAPAVVNTTTDRV